MSRLMKLLLATTVFVGALGVAQAQTATVSRTDASVSGVALSTGLASAAATNYFDNDGRTLYVLKNNNTNLSVTATVVTRQTSLSKDGYATVTITDTIVSAPSSSQVVIGPFPQTQFNSTVGTVRVDLTSSTRVSHTAIRMPVR